MARYRKPTIKELRAREEAAKIAEIEAHRIRNKKSNATRAAKETEKRGGKPPETREERTKRLTDYRATHINPAKVNNKKIHFRTKELTMKQYIREMTKDGKEIVDFWLSVMNGKLTVLKYTGKDGVLREWAPDIKERIEAGVRLAEFGCWAKTAGPEGVAETPLNININLGAGVQAKDLRAVNVVDGKLLVEGSPPVDVAETVEELDAESRATLDGEE